jgi:glycosyltransferase involved in cell wall biosynthesis
MKILHVWNTAGIASIIANEQRKRGHEVEVITRHPFDPFGFTEYYGFKYLNCGADPYLKHCFEIAKNYDVIHFHAIDYEVERYRREYPNKKIIVHYHGSDVMKSDDVKKRLRVQQLTDAIFSSTPDVHDKLIREGVNNTYIPNPIDVDLFKPMDVEKSERRYLYISMRYTDKDKAFKFLSDKIDIDKIDVIDREVSSVPFYEMPELLNKYDTFIDVKFCEWSKGKPLQAYSTTALQSSSCGLNVLNYKGEIVNNIHLNHSPERACDIIDRLILED